MNTPTAAPPPKHHDAKKDDSSRIRLDRFTEMLSQPGAAHLAGSQTWDLNETPHLVHLDNLPAPQLPSIPGLTFIKEVGRGGMGVVFKACQESLNRTVAVKLIHGGSLAGQEERYRFRLEAEVAARLQHPHIVQVYEAGIHQGRAYLIMEWVEDGTLHQWQNGQPVEPRAAAGILANIAEGVQAAHSMGVLHRDLKPANVLLSSHDSASHAICPKVSDFGMAKRLHEAGVTQSGFTIGTPHYMAPEQARGDAGIGIGADIYALGTILYELLTGRPPFQGTAHAVIFAVMNDEPPSPRKWVADLPADLISICQKAMHKEPQHRYESAAALAADLRRYLDHRPVLARSLSTPHRMYLWAKRRPAIAALSLLLLATLIVSFVGMSLLYWRSETQREQAVLARAEMERKELASRELNRFFLRDFFNQASPQKTQGKKLLFSEVLLKVAEDFEKDTGIERLRQFPELIASTRLQLGSTLMHQGHHREAGKLLEDAYAWYAANRPVDDEERTHCFSNLLHLLLEQGQLQKVEPMMRELVAIKVNKFGPYEHPTVSAKSNLIGVLYEQGKMDEAISLARDIYEGLKQSRKPDDAETLHSLSNYAFLVFKAGKYAEAEELQRQCLTECRTQLKENHPYTLLSMNNLASTLRTQKRLDEAEPMMQEVVALSIKISGASHPETLAYQGNYAGLLRDLGRLDDAQQQLETAWQAAKQTKLKHHVVLKLLDGLASLAAQQNRLDAATVYAQELLQTVQSQLDAKHQMQTLARATYGTILFKKQEYPQAIAMLNEAIERSQPHGNALLDTRREAIKTLIACYEAMGRQKEADAVRVKYLRKP